MSSANSSPAAAQAAPKRQLSVFDSTCIIVGIIIGAFIYEMSPVVAGSMGTPLGTLAVWVAGGIISLIGALCYAELATAYPAAGGDYVYLTRAFGRPLGFMFAWAQLWVVRPGSVGMVAFVFARYANEIVPIGQGHVAMLIWASGAITVLSVINILGVREGKWTQNILTTAKVVGLAAIFVVGLFFAAPQPATSMAASGGGADLRLAMILVLIAYGGWNEMAYVAAEVRDPRRNILRALLLGTLAVTAIYVLVNVAFIHALGYAGMCRSGAVAADVLRLAGGDWAGRAISLLICISCLGGINGMIFTGARITYAMGAEHRFYALLGRWHPRLGTPVWALVAQAAVTLALVIGFGLKPGAFQKLVDFETPVFWFFFVLVGVSLFVLRVREPLIERPFRVPAYPVIPALFCLSSLFMLWSSVTWAYDHASWAGLWAVAILVIGLPLSFVDRNRVSGRAAA